MAQDYGVMVLTDGSTIELDDYKTRRNNNVAVLGASGASKTRNYIEPNIAQATGSYIITDPKGNLYRKYKSYLENKGYNVMRVSFVDPLSSLHYNPLDFVNSTQDIQKLTGSLISTETIHNSKDPFWDENSIFFLNSVFAYVYEQKKMHPERCNIPYVLELIRKCGRNDDRKNSEYDKLMEDYKRINSNSWAVKQFGNMSMNPGKTFCTIVSNTLSKFSVFDTPELQNMLKCNEIDFASIGKEKTALFVEVSDTDTSLSPLINLFFTQALDQLCRFADSRPDSRLPVPTRFFFDDFPSIHVDDFDVIISNIRSRKISTTIVFQSLSQLNKGYAESAATILDNCDTFIFMGTNTPETAEMVARRCNKTMDTILHMPIDRSWILRRGETPRYVTNFDHDVYMTAHHPELYSRVNELEK